MSKENAKKINEHGREYIPGLHLSNDMRTLIKNVILEKGGNPYSGSIPRGAITQVAQQLKVSRTTVRNVWKDFCDFGTVESFQRDCGRRPIMNDQELEYVEYLVKEKPSVTGAEIKSKLLQNADVDVSLPTVNRAIHHGLDQENTYKKMQRPCKDRFTVQNLVYTQAFLDELHEANPYKLKFFDESGFKLPDVNTSVYGYGPIGDRVIEVQDRRQTRNVTLNLLVGLTGIYADVVHGPCNTQSYLEFWEDVAVYGTDLHGSHFLTAGDTVVVDNCPTHRNAGGRALSRFLDNIGIQYVFTPSYSPDLNVAEFVFAKLKTIMKSEPYSSMCRDNMEYAIFSALEQISISDIRGYFKKTGYINL